MGMTVQQYRERLFKSKESSRLQSAREPFWDKLEQLQALHEAPSEGRLSRGVLRIVSVMKEAEKGGLIGEFAITGGMAVTYHSEPIYTVDLDVLAVIPGDGILIDLAPIFEFFKQRGASMSGEYLVMEGMKFQFIPAATSLEAESLRQAVVANERAVSFRVVDLEHLIALKLTAGRNKDLLHIQILLDAPRRPIDFSRLEQILEAYGLFEKWRRFRDRFSS
jgi:hypothetical protein